MKFNKGFTLLELLVVIAIIGFLSSVVMASVNSAREKGRIAAGEKFSSAFDHSNLAVFDWSFAETSGLTVFDGAGKLNGTINGGVMRTDGYRKSSKGLCFDGVDDYVTAGVNNRLDVENGDWAISFWMKTEAIEDYRNVFDMNFNNAYANRNAGPRMEQTSITNVNYAGSLGLIIGNNTLHCGLLFNDGGIKDLPSGCTDYTPRVVRPIEINKWHHILAIKKGSTAKSFVDGKLIKDTTLPNGRWPLYFDNIVLGVGYDDGGQNQRYFKGCLDNFKIYSGILNL